MIPLDHDLFTTAPGEDAPWYQVVEPAAAFGRWDARATPDALLLPRDGRWVEVPVGARGATVTVLTAAYGALDARGIAADGELVFADGRTQALKWLVGEQLWPAHAGVTGRGAEPVYVGRSAGGDPLTASALVLPVSWPEVEVRSLRIRAREAPLSVALLDVALSPDELPGVVRTGSGPGWFPFDAPGLLDAPLPLPVAARPDPTDRGFLRAEGERLVFADGTPARLWGVNLVGAAALPAPEVAPRLAATLTGLGFNLIRLHHLDTEQAALDPRRGTRDPSGALRGDFSPEALDRMDRLVAELGRRGGRVALEGMTRRLFRPGEGPPHPVGIPGNHKYVATLWPEWLLAEKAQIRALWGRVNPHTGRRYADDPRVALVELSNENSLVVGWSAGTLERLPGPHRARLDTLWNAWLRRRYPTDARLTAAWSGGDRPGLAPGETLALDSVAREPSSRTRAELYPQARSADLVRFYAELEAAHAAALASFVKDELGFRVPIVCNTSFGVPQADALLGACDVVDLHLYWDPVVETTALVDTPLLAGPRAGRFLEKLSWCQEGRPCVATEVNHGWPNRFGQEAPLLWATLAARQGWSGLAWFAWRHDEVRASPDGPAGSLDLEGRWSTWVQLPAAAALFRGAAVPEARSSWTRWWSPDGLYRELARGPTLWAERALNPWSYLRDRVRTRFGGAPPPPAPPGADPGGVEWDTTAPRMVVRAPLVEAILGRTSGLSPAGRLHAQIPTYAAVSLTALDASPLAEGGRALLVAVGRTERDGTVWYPDEQGVAVVGRGPARLEALTGEVWIRAAGRPRAWALDPRGARGAPVTLSRRGGGWWALRLDGAVTPWWELELPPR